jgi:hypothetical protein
MYETLSTDNYDRGKAGVFASGRFMLFINVFI